MAINSAGIGAANDLAACAFVQGLANAGVRHACVTPGSRSTPLTVALARQRRIRPWVHLDERSSAFFALGLARATGQPVVVVCTSGTAAANFHPAVVEADLSRVPLIFCTADRPPGLRDTGADQTTLQAGMFGRSVRWAADLQVPAGLEGEGRRFHASALRATSAALGPLPGPVHLNFPFEEPLMGAVAGGWEPHRGSSASLPIASAYRPATETISAAATAIRHARRVIVVAGPESGGLPPDRIVALAERLNAPILADPLSGLRTGRHDRSLVLDSYDAILRGEPLPGLEPDCVIRFGAKPTSKALCQFLARQSQAAHLLCDLPGSWRDPDALSTVVIHGSPGSVAETLLDEAGPDRGGDGWSSAWLAANRAAGHVMREQSRDFTEFFEGRVFTELQAALPSGATIFAGNSMPVRDMDSFLESGEKPLRLVANRGAAGIDGVTSSALGAAAAGTGPVVLVTGDISFYHDMNGLWAAARHKLELTVVLINNNGGGIFHYLPQAEHHDVFEEWFATPTNLDFQHAARMYGGRYSLVDTWRAFRSTLAGGEAGGLNIIELPTARARNAAMHRELWASASRAVREVLEPSPAR